MVNGVSGGTLFIKNAWNFGKIFVSGKDNSTVVFFTFNILNAPIYGVSNLSFVRFLVDKKGFVLWFDRNRVSFCVQFFFSFCLALVILVPIAAQLFFIFTANVDAA